MFPLTISSENIEHALAPSNNSTAKIRTPDDISISKKIDELERDKAIL